jgi:hypothetical protein
MVCGVSLVEIYGRFRGTYCVHHHGDDRGSDYLWNVRQFLWDYTSKHLRRHDMFILSTVEREISIYLLIKC